MAHGWAVNPVRVRWARRAGAAVLLAVVAGRAVDAQVAANEPPAPDDAVLSGATLETSPDAEALLTRAREYIGQQQYREATLLLQHVIDQYGQKLIDQGGGHYRPAREAVETLLTQTGPKGLGVYRLSADPQALATLGEPATASVDPAALRDVAERYFVSSYGDDAAYALACLLVERGQAARAAFWFGKIARAHPDPSADRATLQARLAAALARSGDATGARHALAAARQAGAPAALLTQIETMPALTARPEPAAAAAGAWAMAFGSPRRDGMLPAIAAPTGAASRWYVAWRRDTPLGPGAGSPTGGLAIQRTAQPTRRNDLADRWRQNHWRPTGSMLMADGLAFCKSGETVFAFNPATGEPAWRHRPDAAAAGGRPAVANVQLLAMQQARRMTTPYPAQLEEMLLFGDLVGREIAWIDGQLIHIEGASPMGGATNFRVAWVNGRPVRQADASQLVALDATTGALRWRSQLRSRTQPDAGAADAAGGAAPQGGMRIVAPPPRSAVRFVSGPVPVGGRLFVAADDGGELLLVEINPANGEEIARHFICAAAPGYAPPWAPVGLAVEGGAVYLSTGRGVAAAFDVAQGAVQWVTRYERRDPAAGRHAGMRLNYATWAAGGQQWDRNAVFCAAGRVVVVAADAAEPVVIDRISGRRLHKIDARDTRTGRLDSVVGLAGGRLYLAGKEHVACFDTATGKLRWVGHAPGTTGRAILAGERVYVPTDRLVSEIDAATGKLLARRELSTELDEPLGNLLTDGRRLYAAGMSEIVALVDAPSELDRLARAIDAGRGEANLQRALLYEQRGDTALALADLRAARQRLADGACRALAEAKLFEVLMRSVEADGQTDLLDEAAALVGADAGRRARVALMRAAADASAGRWADAAERYRQIAMADGGVWVATADPAHTGGVTGLDQAASTAARRALIELEREHGDELVALLERAGGEALTEAAAAESPDARVEALLRVARAHPGAPVALKAIDRAAAIVSAGESKRFAAVEATLIALTLADDEATASAARAQLATAYAGRGLGEDAARLTEAGRPRVDPDALLPPAPAPNLATGLRLADPPLAALWYRGEAFSQPLSTLAGSNIEAQTLRDAALIDVPGQNRMTLRDPVTQASRWSLELPADAAQLGVSRGVDRDLRGGVQRHLLVLRSPGRVMGFDLADGGRMWDRQLDPALRPYRWYAGSNYSACGIGPRVYVERFWHDAEQCDVAMAFDLATGRPLWRVRFTDHELDGVWVVGDRVAMVVDRGRQAWLLDAATGRRLTAVRMSDYQANRPVTWTGYGVAYAAPNRLAFAATAPGARDFAINRAAVIRAVDLDGRHLAVGWSDRSMSVIDTATGAELWRKAEGDLVRVIGDVAVGPDGGLYVVGASVRNQQALVVVDLLTGEVRRRIEFGVRTGLRWPSGRQMALAGPNLPLLESDVRDRNRATLRLYGPDGEPADAGKIATPWGESVVVNPAGPPFVRGGVLLVPTRSGLLAVGDAKHAPADRAAAGLTLDANAADNPTPNQTVRVNGGQIIINQNGQRVEIKRMQLRGGGRIEIRQNNGRIEIRQNGQPVPLPPPPTPNDKQDEKKPAGAPGSEDDR